MTKRFRPALLWPLFAAASLQCTQPSLPSEGDGGGARVDGGTSADGGADAGSSGASAASACSAISARRCDLLQRCGLIESGEVPRRECVALYDVLSCGPGAWPSRVVAGTLSFDATLAAACAASWAASSCADFAVEPAVCAEFLSPASPLGGACYGGPVPECGEGVCRKAGCPKQCQALGQPGEDCERDADCDRTAGLYCLSARPASYCARFGAATAPCDADRRCGEGLFCQNGTCQPRAEVGQPCESGGCVDGGWCLFSGGASDGGTCMARADAGASCTADPQCEAGLLCEDTERRCVPSGPLAAGAPCRGRQLCAPSTVCIGETPSSPGVCEPARDAGEDCARSDQCKPPFACGPGGGPGLCTERLADTSLCQRDRDCLAFSRCVQGSCTRLPRLGESCVDACLMGLCTVPDGGLPDAGRLCSGFGGPSALCQRDSQCASGRCVSGACAAICAP